MEACEEAHSQCDRRFAQASNRPLTRAGSVRELAALLCQASKVWDFDEDAGLRNFLPSRYC